MAKPVPRELVRLLKMAGVQDDIGEAELANLWEFDENGITVNPSGSLADIITAGSRKLTYDESAGIWTLNGKLVVTDGLSALPEGYIRGLMPYLTNTGFFGVYAGECSDSTGNYILTCPSSFFKDIGGSWFAGSGAGPPYTAVAPGETAAVGWWDIYAIGKSIDSSAFDLMQTQRSPSLMGFPPTYDIYRYLGSMYCDSAITNRAASVYNTAGGGIKVHWHAAHQSFSTAGTGVAQVVTCLAPNTPGPFQELQTVFVDVQYGIAFNGDRWGKITALSQPDSAPGGSDFDIRISSGGVWGNVIKTLPTSSIGQIRVRTSAATSQQFVHTLAWSHARCLA